MITLALVAYVVLVPVALAVVLNNHIEVALFCQRATRPLDEWARRLAFQTELMRRHAEVMFAAVLPSMNLAAKAIADFGRAWHAPTKETHE